MELSQAVLKFLPQSSLWRLHPSWREILQDRATCWHDLPQFPLGGILVHGGTYCWFIFPHCVVSGYGSDSSRGTSCPLFYLLRILKSQSSFSHASSTWKMELMIMLSFLLPVGISHAVFWKICALNSIVCGSIITPNAVFWRSMQIVPLLWLTVLIFDVCAAGHRQGCVEALKEGMFSMSQWCSHI